MRSLLRCVDVTRKSFPALVLCVSLAAACESARQTTSPSPTPRPSPTPSPVPVSVANEIMLPPPATPPTSAADPLVGRYTLEIAVARSGAICDAVPDHVRRRTFTADIHPFRDYYAVKLYDATFLRDTTGVRYGCVDSRLETGGVCHQFTMARDGDRAVSVDMTALDEWRGSEIWEVLDRRLIELHGKGTGSIEPGRIVVSGNGGLWYGNGLPASEVAACEPDIVWTFTRQ